MSLKKNFFRTKFDYSFTIQKSHSIFQEEDYTKLKLVFKRFSFFVDNDIALKGASLTYSPKNIFFIYIKKKSM